MLEISDFTPGVRMLRLARQKARNAPSRRLLDVLDVLDRARGCGALATVRREGHDAVKSMVERLERAGRTAPYCHGPSRPEVVEREAAHRAISHAEPADVPMMIVPVVRSGRL